MCVVRSDRRIRGKLDNAFVVIGNLQFELRHQHPATLDAANLADAQRHVFARDEGAGRHEDTFHARARVRRAAHDLDRLARASIDHAHAQAVRVRMLLGRDHSRDGEWRQHFAPVCDTLDLETDHGELVDNGCKRRLGVEVFLQPSKREFHHSADPGLSPRPNGNRSGD